MGLEFIHKLPTPEEIRQQFPIPSSLTDIKARRDEAIRQVFTGESDRF